MEDPGRVGLQDWAWFSLGYCGHLENEPVDRSLSLPFPLSITCLSKLAINKSHKKCFSVLICYFFLSFYIWKGRDIEINLCPLSHSPNATTVRALCQTEARILEFILYLPRKGQDPTTEPSPTTSQHALTGSWSWEWSQDVSLGTPIWNMGFPSSVLPLKQMLSRFFKCFQNLV